MNKLKSLKINIRPIKIGANLSRFLNAPFFLRLSIKDQTLFAKRLSFLVRSGVPILDSFHILKDQTKSKSTSKIFESVILDISNGKYLYKSLARFERVFGDFAINIIRIGETSGVLSQNLGYLADELQKKHALRRKVLGALVYPIFITIATLGVTGLLTVYIFPKIMPIFQSLNVTLPITTRILLWVSNFLRDYGLILIGVVIVLTITTVVLHRRVKPFRFFTDRILLNMPIGGGIMKNYNMANFCRTFGILLKSGVTGIEALTITSDTTTNLVYKKEYRTMAKKALKGEPISKHLGTRLRLFPSILTHMIAIGEKTGKLSETLMYLAELYENEVEDATKNLSSSIEPILMVFMGFVVGFVAVSVITPIYEITQNLQG